MMKDFWKTRFEPFPGLCVLSPLDTWYKLKEICNDKVIVDRYDRCGTLLTLNDEWNFWFNNVNRYVLFECELWPGEPDCPELPTNLWYTIDPGQNYWFFNHIDQQWEKNLWNGPTLTLDVSIYIPIPISVSLHKHITKCNYNTTCPLCGSPAELLFKLTCSNSSCINY